MYKTTVLSRVRIESTKQIRTNILRNSAKNPGQYMEELTGVQQRTVTVRSVEY